MKHLSTKKWSTLLLYILQVVAHNTPKLWGLEGSEIHLNSKRSDCSPKLKLIVHTAEYCFSWMGEERTMKIACWRACIVLMFICTTDMRRSRCSCTWAQHIIRFVLRILCSTFTRRPAASTRHYNRAPRWFQRWMQLSVVCRVRRLNRRPTPVLDLLKSNSCKMLDSRFQ